MMPAWNCRRARDAPSTSRRADEEERGHERVRTTSRGESSPSRPARGRARARRETSAPRRSRLCCRASDLRRATTTRQSAGARAWPARPSSRRADLKGALEALILVSDKPVQAMRLARLTARTWARCGARWPSSRRTTRPRHRARRDRGRLSVPHLASLCAVRAHAGAAEAHQALARAARGAGDHRLSPARHAARDRRRARRRLGLGAQGAARAQRDQDHRQKRRSRAADAVRHDERVPGAVRAEEPARPAHARGVRGAHAGEPRHLRAPHRRAAARARARAWISRRTTRPRR